VSTAAEAAAAAAGELSARVAVGTSAGTSRAGPVRLRRSQFGWFVTGAMSYALLLGLVTATGTPSKVGGEGERALCRPHLDLT
jgi:hypothetical protein